MKSSVNIGTAIITGESNPFKVIQATQHTPIDDVPVLQIKGIVTKVSPNKDTVLLLQSADNSLFAIQTGQRYSATTLQNIASIENIVDDEDAIFGAIESGVYVITKQDGTIKIKSQKANITIDASGDISVAGDNINISVAGNSTINSQGNTTITSPNITLNGTTTIGGTSGGSPILTMDAILQDTVNGNQVLPISAGSTKSKAL